MKVFINSKPIASYKIARTDKGTHQPTSFPRVEYTSEFPEYERKEFQLIVWYWCPESVCILSYANSFFLRHVSNAEKELQARVDRHSSLCHQKPSIWHFSDCRNIDIEMWKIKFTLGASMREMMSW